MRYLLIVLLCLVTYVNDASGANRRDVPPWVNGEFPPKSNDSYVFMVSDGSGTSLGDAQKDADLGLVTNLMRSSGVTVSSSQIEKIIFRNHNDNIEERLDATYQYEFNYGDVNIAFRAVDQYYTSKGNLVEVKTLYEVAKKPSNVFYEPVEYTTSYGASGLWRSVLIPGWGQMYKRQYAKGSIIIAAEAALITTTLIYENQKSSYMKKSHATFDPNAIRFYQNKAHKAKVTRDCLIGAAAAVYVYNLIDALVAKGKLRYIKHANKHVALMPFVSEGSYAGLYFSYQF